MGQGVKGGERPKAYARSPSLCPYAHMRSAAVTFQAKRLHTLYRGHMANVAGLLVRLPHWHAISPGFRASTARPHAGSTPHASHD